MLKEGWKWILFGSPSLFYGFLLFCLLWLGGIFFWGFSRLDSAPPEIVPFKSVLPTIDWEEWANQYHLDIKKQDNLIYISGNRAELIQFWIKILDSYPFPFTFQLEQKNYKTFLVIEQ